MYYFNSPNLQSFLFIYDLQKKIEYIVFLLFEYFKKSGLNNIYHKNLNLTKIPKLLKCIFGNLSIII